MVLWGEGSLPGAANALQAAISRLRRAARLDEIAGISLASAYVILAEIGTYTTGLPTGTPNP